MQGAENVKLGEVNFTASRFIYGTLEKPILDTIDYADILGDNVDANTVTQKLNLPGTVSSKKCGTANLTWISSNPSAYALERAASAGIPTAVQFSGTG